MEHVYLHHDASFNNPGKYEIEVEIEEEQETTTAEGILNFCECALRFIDKPAYQGIPNHQGDGNHARSLNGIDCDVAYVSQEASHQSPGQIPLEELVSTVQQPRKSTRPRIRRGLTPWQLNKLERVFKEVQYPNEISEKSLAKHLYMKESEVHHWFKKRRAKYRKNQVSEGAPDGIQNVFN